MKGRRAVIRWAWRLFRREWRQQILVITLITLAIAVTVGAAAASYNAAPSRDAEFGTASHRLELSSEDPAALQAEIEAIDEWFGASEAIPQWNATVPGLTEEVPIRGQSPNGAFAGTTLALQDGSYPGASDELALTDHWAEVLKVGVGDPLTLGDHDSTVVGLVENPDDLSDEFALATPDLAEADGAQVLLDTTEDQIRERPLTEGEEDGLVTTSAVVDRGDVEKGTAALVVYLAATIVLLLVALVAGAGFVVMAQRRQRQIGLLAATGASDKQMRLVMIANGMAVGLFAAVVGAGAGLLVWLAIAPSVEPVVGHRIDRFDVPWWIVALGMVFAVVTATGASWWPARTVARMSVTQALSARPPQPRSARRPALLAGLLLALGIAAIVWANPKNWDDANTRLGEEIALMAGVVAIPLGMLFLCPLAVRGFGRLAQRLPFTPRLAVRDLSRYQARSGAALGAISLALGIPVAAITIAEANQQEKESGQGGNLAPEQILVSTSLENDGGFIPYPPPTPAEIEALDADAARIADAVDASIVIPLDVAYEPGTEPPPGFDVAESVGVGYPISEDTSRDVNTYVASPELLDYYGLDAAELDPDVDVLTVRKEELSIHGEKTKGGPETTATVEMLDTPAYSSAPTTLLTPALVERGGWDSVRVGWLIVTDDIPSSAQLGDARDIAAGAEFSLETRTEYYLGSLGPGAAAGGTLVALAVVAMTVGLIRSEATGDLRTLSAAGATRTIRRRLTAWTAGALGLLGVILGMGGAYVALASGYVRELGTLAHAPVLELTVLGLGVPILAGAAGWLVDGREPTTLAQRSV